MPTFAKNESLVEAIQYDGDNMEEVAQFINDTTEYTAIMDFNETWVGYLLNRFNTIKRIDKTGQWLVLEGGQLYLKEDEEFAPRYTEVIRADEESKTMLSNFAPSRAPRVINTVEDFPKDERNVEWKDNDNCIWYWHSYSPTVCPENGGWTWRKSSEVAGGNARGNFDVPFAGDFPMVEIIK